MVLLLTIKGLHPLLIYFALSGLIFRNLKSELRVKSVTMFVAVAELVEGTEIYTPPMGGVLIFTRF